MDNKNKTEPIIKHDFRIGEIKKGTPVKVTDFVLDEATLDRFRRLEVGEIILETDYYLEERQMKFHKPICIGKPAPAPQYPAHRKYYRKRVFISEIKNKQVCYTVAPERDAGNICVMTLEETMEMFGKEICNLTHVWGIPWPVRESRPDYDGLLYIITPIQMSKEEYSKLSEFKGW